MKVEKENIKQKASTKELTISSMGFKLLGNVPRKTRKPYGEATEDRLKN